MVLVDEELEKYGINLPDIDVMKNTKELYTTINIKRNKFFENQYPESFRYIEEIKRDHITSQNFVKNLISQSEPEILKFLIAQNKAPEYGASSCRTLVLMDATGSMSNLLTKAKNTVKTMFERIGKVLDKHGLTTVVLMQFAVYRNYSSGAEYLLQYSSWESMPHVLNSYINSIGTNGGQGNEAVEIGLAHALEEHSKEEIDQVILIGDMPPNTNDEVNSNRASHCNGEAYWQQYDKFKKAVYVDELLPAIKAKGFPVHGFYVDSSARASFERISIQTGGTSQFLDVNSDTGADDLTDCVSQFVLKSAGGNQLGQLLVDEYKKMFNRGFVAS